MFFLSGYGELFFKSQKIPLLDSPALCFRRQVAKLAPLPKKNTGNHPTRGKSQIWLQVIKGQQ
jgi:hypothetical protein